MENFYVVIRKEKVCLVGHVCRSLKEMVKDCEQLRQFREFLARQRRDSEVQLLFWLALEDLRETSPNSRACQGKMERIVRNFIKNKETKKCA